MLTYTRTVFSIQLPLLGLLLALLLGASKAQAVTYTWNGSVSTSWNTAANWTPAAGSPAGVPAAGDDAIINSCTTCPVLTRNESIYWLTINSGGKLNIGGFTLTSPRLKLWGGKITSQAGTLQVVYVDDIRYCEFLGGKITINIGPNGGGRIYGGNTYNGPVEYRWTNTSSLAGSSFYIGFFIGESYVSDAVFINDSIGWLGVSYAATSYFGGKVTVHNSNQGRTTFGDSNLTSGGIFFNQDVEVNNSGDYVRFATGTNMTAEFKGAVTVNNTRTVSSGNHFTEFGGGSVTFHGPVTISHLNPHFNSGVSFFANAAKNVFKEKSSLTIGANGFLGGKLSIRNMEFRNANTETKLVLGGGAIHLELGPATSFAAPFEGKANNILLNGVTFTGNTKLEKFGGHTYSSTNNLGGNIFNGSTTLINSGGQPWYFGQNAPDQFNGNLTVTHTGGNGTYLAHWSAGHVFKGNVSLNLTPGSPSMSHSIQVGAGGGISRLEEGSTITGTFSSGDLRLYNFTQAGATNQNIVLTGTAGLRLEKGCRFEGPLTATAGAVYLNGAVFAAPLRLTKTAPGDNASTGGNKFSTRAALLNQASSGSIQLATQAPDEILQKAAVPLN